MRKITAHQKKQAGRTRGPELSEHNSPAERARGGGMRGRGAASTEHLRTARMRDADVAKRTLGGRDR